MITSIVVTGCHNIKMNSNKKIKIEDNVLSIEKDIPFIRYRFDDYTENEYNYIKRMTEQFNCSTHLVEIKLNEKTKDVLAYLEENIPNLARFIYTDVTDAEVESGRVSDNIRNLFGEVAYYQPDRYMLKDKSTSLDTVAAKKIIKDLSKSFNIDEDSFGVCSSPLSFGEMACLTAVRARELMSIYSRIADVALPSANHQCMNCCGCIRYMVVSADTEAPADGKVKGQSKPKSESTEKKSNTSSKPKSKQSLPFMQFI